MRKDLGQRLEAHFTENRIHHDEKSDSYRYRNPYESAPVKCRGRIWCKVPQEYTQYYSEKDPDCEESVKVAERFKGRLLPSSQGEVLRSVIPALGVRHIRIKSARLFTIRLSHVHPRYARIEITACLVGHCTFEAAKGSRSKVVCRRDFVKH
ncbi:hypothetical protein RRF57_010492 [Xylaria bambusicola]|uniref:Uncharacterized protein n=1 Tax=Xylaria bambusicola TaxID=326684 RepID=A0AAN7UV34_9PEZI